MKRCGVRCDVKAELSQPSKSKRFEEIEERWALKNWKENCHQIHKSASWQQVSDTTHTRTHSTATSHYSHYLFSIFLLLYSSHLVPSGCFSPVPERIVSRCYQTLLMVSFHYITIFVLVFTLSMLHSASRWDRGAPGRQTILCMSSQFVSAKAHKTVCLWVTAMQFMLSLWHLHIV